MTALLPAINNAPLLGARKAASRTAHSRVTNHHLDRAVVYVRSIVWTTIVLFVAVALPCWLWFNWKWGVGLGAMTAFWGGPGFGVMVAGARVELALERQHQH